jgi:hypothetical protein
MDRDSEIVVRKQTNHMLFPPPPHIFALNKKLKSCFDRFSFKKRQIRHFLRLYLAKKLFDRLYSIPEYRLKIRKKSLWTGTLTTVVDQ